MTTCPDRCRGVRRGSRVRPRRLRRMSIVDNRKAYHDYFVEEKFEAGLALEGWEVKAIRAGRAQLKEAYVIVKGGEIVLIGAHIMPLATASTHVQADPTRTRKLLLHKNEIHRLVGQVERAGYTLVPLNLHYTRGRVKLDVGLAKGKKQYDKRATIKEREWNREQQRLIRNRTALRGRRERGEPRDERSDARRRSAARRRPSVRPRSRAERRQSRRAHARRVPRAQRAGVARQDRGPARPPCVHLSRVRGAMPPARVRARATRRAPGRHRRRHGAERAGAARGALRGAGARCHPQRAQLPAGRRDDRVLPRPRRSEGPPD